MYDEKASLRETNAQRRQRGWAHGGANLKAGAGDIVA